MNFRLMISYLQVLFNKVWEVLGRKIAEKQVIFTIIKTSDNEKHSPSNSTFLIKFYFRAKQTIFLRVQVHF